MAIIKQIESLYDICGRESILQSDPGGLIPLPSWVADDVVIIGPQKSKTVYLIHSPDSRESQAFYVAATACMDKRVSIAGQLVAESSIIKILKQEKTGSKLTTKTSSASDQILFETLMKEAVAENVSDILIDNSNGRYTVKFDIDTIVRPVRGITRDEAEAMMRHFYQNIADQDVVEDSIFSFDKAQFAAGDGIWNDQKVRVRYQSKPSFPEGCDFSLRLLNLSDSAGFNRYTDLCLSPSQLALFQSMNQTESGAVLVAGITGSGKTTTIKVLIEECLQENPGIQIRTAESPPEYVIRGARQHHVGEDVSGETDVYAETVKELMRMRPDRIYIGEIRSRQTAELFSKAVLSGHGVYTTIHTDSPYEIITRLEGEGVSRDVVSSGNFINGLIYQKRLPRLCNDCKLPLDANTDLNKRLSLLKTDLSGVFTQNPEGCQSCGNSGVRGSIVCMEIVKPNRKMRNALRKKNEQEFYKYWLELGQEAGYGDAVETALYHGLKNMVKGIICPTHIERRFSGLTPLLLKEQTHTWSEDNGFSIPLV
ncbi:GspE/PulE family protein [Endozoicomonas sp. ALC066]|uniref:GspE/PulE family protein n=1 Tax=Endozoicomonas sp. ALC066 TaxID=3403078 RepID=UPI003BB80B69